MTHLNINDLNHVLQLAHLELPEDEKPAYLKQLQDVLTSMQEMDQFDLSQVAPATHANLDTHFIREDVVALGDDLLKEKNAPEWEQEGFRVPKILGESA